MWRLGRGAQGALSSARTVTQSILVGMAHTHTAWYMSWGTVMQSKISPSGTRTRGMLVDDEEIPTQAGNDKAQVELPQDLHPRKVGLDKDTLQLTLCVGEGG